MELFRPEAEKLRKMVEGWLPREKRELEATFGLGGQVDQSRFLDVVKRLKARGFVERPPEDYMTITIKDAKSDINVRRDTLKNNTRFTIVGTSAIEEYCRQESLDNLKYSVILKTPIGNPNEDDLTLDDYEMKYKVRREEERDPDEAIVAEIISTWPKQKKAFRLIRRWTFDGEGCVFDLSMVRSNKKNLSGAYIFTENFSDKDYSILNQKPTYEIEVELKHGPDTDTVDKAMKLLVKATGEILRGLQRSTILIRKTQKKRALDGYFNLIGINEFRGVKPRTLEMKNFISKRLGAIPNIRDGYNVTDKADGLRVLGYCDDKGELFLIDKALNVYRTGLLNENCRESLVDGEWITTIHDKDDPSIQKATTQLWLFDIYIAPNKKKVDDQPFYTEVKEAPSRYNELVAWNTLWNKDGPTVVSGGVTASNRLVVRLKGFLFARPGNEDIFKKAKEVLARKSEYNTDGLIFTSNKATLPGADTNFKEQFKWKPAEDNTIDFLVRFEKDPETGEDLVKSEEYPLTNKTVLYKKLILKVGSSMNAACANARDTILFEREIPKGGCHSEKYLRDPKEKYKAVPFNPSDYADPMASVCKVELQEDLDANLQYIRTEKTLEPILDMSIVEMRYDMKRPEGWRWVPVRIRVDKTEKLERGELGGTLNADFTADSVWNSIHNPITKGMITTGNEAPTKDDFEDDDEERLVDVNKPYFERKANKQQLQSVEGLRNFHKHHIKGDILLRPTLAGGGKYLLDLAVGEAADINRWIANEVGFVYGMDIAAKGILDSHRGAYTKYLNRLSENAGLPESQQIQIAPMIFGIGNVSKSLATGDAGFNEEESNILRSVFGKVAPAGPIPPFVEHQGKDKLKDGADVIACMFALHYFFKDIATFTSFLNNINQHLAVNGYFVACFFDGQKVFDLLKSKKEGESVTGVDRRTAVWRITKKYTSDTLPSDDTGFGLAIQNKFISIGAEHEEYLVPFELFENKMNEIGCYLITDKSELDAMKLPASTETFDVTYKRATAEAKKAGKEIYPMAKAVQEYSFLNRWCIFKRISKTPLNEEQRETVEAVVQAANAATVETKAKTPAKTTRPKSLAWQGVPESGDAKVNLAVDEVGLKAEQLEAAKPKNSTGAISNLVVVRSTEKKPMEEGLGTAIAGVTVGMEPPDKEYEPSTIFPFGPNEDDTSILKDAGGAIILKDAARYLAPYMDYTIVDNEDPKKPVNYPSILHYMAAMEYKKATNKPDLAVTLFSTEGKIHSESIRKSLLERGTPEQLQALKQERMIWESKEIAKNSPILNEKKFSIVYDASKWILNRDKYLELAYNARFAKDEKFRSILEKLREMEKYLLYRPTPKLSEGYSGILGGVLKQVGRGKKKMVKVEGGNMLGKLLMRLAGFPGYDTKIEPGVVEGKEL